MSNPLFSQFGGMQNMSPMVQQFMQFKNSFSGDARSQVQQLLNSGKVSQAQYDKAVQMANQLSQMMK